MTTTQNTVDKITTAILAKIAPVSTNDLLFHHKTAEDMNTTDDMQRLVQSIMADELTRRLDINPEMDTIFEDLDYEGTYHEAIVIAIELRKNRA